MKKTLALLLVAVIVCISFPLHRSGAVEPSQIRSLTAVLMDADTGQILYNKGMHHRVYPASTTKILTALLVVENTHPHEIVTASSAALDLPYYGAHIALVVDERISVEDALFAMMLPSANDASNVLAEHVAGSLEAFAEMMTRRAHEIGAVNSNFTNAHGLHEEGHFTTAYDMALITRHAMENEEFRRYFGAAHHFMPATNMNVERNLHQMQYMLVPGIAGFDPEVTGGKVGFTNAARHTMSTTATRDGRNLVATVMYSPVRWDKFVDTRALLDFGFDEFVPFVVEADQLTGGTMPIMRDNEEIGVAAFEHAEPFTALIHTSADPSELQVLRSAPEYYDIANPTNYTISFELPGFLPFVPSLLGVIELEPHLDIPISAAALPLDASQGTATTPYFLSALRIIGITLGAAVFVFAVFVLDRRRRIIKRRRRRVERFEQSLRRAEQARVATVRQVLRHNNYRKNDSYTGRRAR